MQILAMLILASALGTGYGSCPMDAHRHELQLAEDGKTPIVYLFGTFDKSGEPEQPPIVMDGLCHDDKDEHIIDDPDRKKLPKPVK